jgi:hypothetical protein
METPESADSGQIWALFDGYRWVYTTEISHRGALRDYLRNIAHKKSRAQRIASARPRSQSNVAFAKSNRSIQIYTIEGD